jgi:nucleotide-binding universal stress UspA family protein
MRRSAKIATAERRDRRSEAKEQQAMMTEVGAAQPGGAPGKLAPLLVPLDGTAEARSALPYALALAAPAAEIILVTAVPEMAETQAAQARAQLDEVADELRQLGHDVQTRVVSGDAAAGILQSARAAGAGMIVIASHDRSAFGRLVHGSVADRVAREASVPTMVVRTAEPVSGPVGITRLVVPLDGSSLAEEALPVAVAISRRLQSPLVLLRAVNPADLLPPAVGIGEAIPFGMYDALEQEQEHDAQSYLETVAARLRQQGVPVVTGVLSGSPARAITEATKPGDVVVLTSYERNGLLRWLLGSVAEEIAHEDESPVIFVPAAEHASGER